MHRHTPSKNAGFALIIALSLMAFVLLLLLSVTTLINVETTVAKSSTATAQARQNALLALNIAVGRLQKETGPDQRTTARAALNDGTGASINQPNWVGVYGNGNVADYSQNPSAITPSAPILLNWLVSGNEETTFAASTGSTNFGQITQFTAPDDIAHKPSDAIPNLATATAKSTLQIAGADAQLLVGPSSTNSNLAAGNYVAAPLVDIGGSNGTTGRYAWWVGDEGAKAKVNLRPSYLDQTDSSDQAEYLNYSYLTAQRSALEFVEYDDSGNRIDTEFDFTDPDLAKVEGLEAFAFLGGGSANFESAVTERFHDLTGYGHGVLADTYAGGLKKDLTAYFNGSSQGPLDTDTVFTPLQASDEVPTWGQARSLVNQSITYTSGAAGIPVAETDPIVPSETTNGIYPIIAAASLGFDFYITGPIIPPATALDPTPYYQFQVAVIPAVALWNPHTVAIKASTYDMGLRIDSDSGSSPVWVDFGSSESDEADMLDLYNGNWESVAANGNNFLKFRLQGETLAPGETQLYSLPTNGDAYEPGVSLMTISDEGVDNIINHVSMSSESLKIQAVENPIGSGDYSLPAGLTIRVASNSTRNAGDEQRFNLVLADEGGLSDLNSRDNWYHSVMDARLYHRGAQRNDSRASGGNRANVWLDSSHYGNVSDLALHPDDVTGENISVYRLVMPMERRGTFMTSGYFVGSLMAGHENNAGRMRWLVTGNPRAPIMRNTRVENEITVSGNSLYGAMHYSNGSSFKGDDLFFPYVTSTNGSRLSAGRGQSSSGTSGYGVAALFDQLDSPDQFLSLGQLQHSVFGKYGFYPSYQFGNSWADVRIERDQHYLGNTVSAPYQTNNSQTLYDMSWHLNRAIWDRYFVSTVPSTWTASDITGSRPLPNSRISYYENPEIDSIQGDDAYDEAAANLWTDGAFNINSTSEQAWRTLLSATFGIPNLGDRKFADSGDLANQIAPIPRFTRNQSQIAHNNVNFLNAMQSRTTSGGGNYNYIGNRGLSMKFNGTYNGTVDEIVAELARTIVNEIKLRGPFLSLGDFVNRKIIDQSTDTNSIGIKGALQAAIDKMSEDDQTGPRVNSWEWQANHGTGFDSDDAYVMVRDRWITEHYLGGPDKGIGNQADMPYSVSATASPSCMTPADLLTVIGPAISARSDTFRIRTYGETINPVTQETEGRAWCEAIVQRLPEYLDTVDAPEDEPVALSSGINTRFGRKYKILSLRWLDAADI